VVGEWKVFFKIIFVFWEKTPSLFNVFQTYNWCSESYRIGLAFRDAVFHRFGFFSFVDLLISQSDLFLFAFFCFLYFLFFESRDDDEVAYLVYVVRNDEVGWQQNKNNLFNHLLPPLLRPHHLPLLKIRKIIEI
jgi:hypothetical protein